MSLGQAELRPDTTPADLSAAPSHPTRSEVALLRELVAIPSFSGAEQRAAGWLVSRLQGLGVEAGLDHRGSVVARVEPSAGGTTKGEVYLLGHVDTVGGFWPPLLKAGRLFGRGTSDAKGPLAAFICAALRSRDGGRLRRSVRILAAVEEESSSRGALELARSLPPPAFLLVGEPSGWERLITGYRGSVQVELLVEARPGHSSRPDPTVAELGLRAWAGVQLMVRELNGGAVGFDALGAHLLGIETGSDGLTDFARLQLGFRLPTRLSASLLADRLRQLDGVSVEVRESEEAALVPRSGPLPTALARAIRQQGGRPGWRRRLGTSDLNVVAPLWRCPALVYGPGSAELDHTPDESIGMEDYGRAIGVLQATLEAL